MTAQAASRSTTELMRGPAFVGAVGTGAVTLLRLRDPHVSGSYGFCPFLAITGYPCPGCGGLRAVNDLAHGDFAAAVSSNLFAVLIAATLVVAWAVWAARRWRGRNVPMFDVSVRAALMVLAAFIVFGVVRNTPWGAWLAP